MSAIVVRADARCLPLPDAGVDLIVTSPPYFGLRSYTDGGEHYGGQIGSEATPAEWLAAMLDCTREWMRVLKPQGSLFVNLGDKYSDRGHGPNRGNGTGRGPQATLLPQTRGPMEKSLLGLPWRYALACMDDLGLILRRDIIWHKPNCLSGGTMVYAKVKGRPTTIKVHDLCRHYAPEQVQLWNGQRWTQVLWWQPVGRHPEAAESMKAIRAARRRGDEPMAAADVEIELRSGERIGCTREHRWPTQRGLVEAASLVTGDVLDTCPIPEGETAPAALDDDMIGWFVGLYIAEGSHGSDRTIQISGHVKEIERYKRLRELAEAFHGTCTVYATHGNAATINLTGRFLDAIIDTYVGGRTAKDKHLRPACWQRSNRFLRAMLDGYLSGDGHWRENAHRWIVNFTDNDALAADLRALGARLGLSVRLTRCTHTGFGKEWPGWRGNITEPQRRRQPDSQIVAIRQSRARQFWDIGVEDEPHLFALASGVLTHNSLPESVTDRCRSSHEYLFHLVKQPRYYAAVDEIREDYGANTHAGRRDGLPSPATRAVQRARPMGAGLTQLNGDPSDRNPLGKLPGSVWEIPSQPLRVPESLGVDHFACVDTETEILTRRGWLHNDAVQVGDEVAGYDLDTGVTSWTRCHAVHRYDYDGELVAVEARGLSMRLTPNHRVLAHRHAGRHAFRQPVEVIDASGLTKLHAIPRAVEWADDGREKAIGADLATLCGWVAAEGWYQDGRSVHLSQSAGVNGDHVAAIDALLDRLGTGEHVAGRNIYPSRGKWRARIGYQGRSHNLGSYERPEDAEQAVREFRAARGLDLMLRTEAERNWRGRAWIDVSWRLASGVAAEVRRLMPDKLLAAWMADLPLGEARALLDAFIAGDGHTRPDGRRSVFQKERANLDVLQAIAVRCGYNTTLRYSGRRWVLYLNPPRPARLRRSDGTPLVGREHYKGIVWCVTTGTGTFVARRNGAVFVTGNSFPMELPRRIILGWSPSGICTACGEGRRPDFERGEYRQAGHGGTYGATPYAEGQPGSQRLGSGAASTLRTIAPRFITGYACACPDATASTRPAVVADPFGGTGTTALVAAMLGRDGYSFDLSMDYARLARWRVADPGERAKAMQVPKPPKQADGQGDLFEDLSA